MHFGELRKRLVALVDAQIAREQGRRPTGSLASLDDEQLAVEINRLCATLRLGAEESVTLVDNLRARSREGDPFGIKDVDPHPESVRSATWHASRFHVPPWRWRIRDKCVVRSCDVVGPVRFKARKTAVGVLSLIELMYAVPFFLLVITAAATGYPVPHGDYEKFRATMVLPLSLLAVAYLHAQVRQRLAVQRGVVDRDGTITLIRYGRERPFDLAAYPYVRLKRFVWGAPRRVVRHVPGMLIMRRDSPVTFWNALSTHFFPRFNDERVIVFFQSWWTADGGWIAPDAMGEVFRQACIRAGRRPVFDTEFGRSDWEVRD